VMIVDDRFVRIGSANFSRRSMGVDSECDLAAYAGVADDDAGAGAGTGVDSRHRAGVRRIRDRLIGEHLGMSAEAVEVFLSKDASLLRLVDSRSAAARCLRELPAEDRKALGVEFGLVVLEVARPNAGMPIMPGDVIVAVNEKPFKSLEEFNKLIADAPKGQTLALLVRRGEGALYVPVEVG